MKTICQILGYAALPLLALSLAAAGMWVQYLVTAWRHEGTREQLPEVGHVDRAGRYIHPSGRTVANPETLTRDVQPTKTLVST